MSSPVGHLVRTCPPPGPDAAWCGRSAEPAGRSAVPVGEPGWDGRSGHRGRVRRDRARRPSAPGGPALVPVKRVTTTARGREPTYSARTAVALDGGPRSGNPDRRWEPSVSSPDIRPPGSAGGTELVWSGWRRSAPTSGCLDKAFPRVSAEPSRIAEPALLRVPHPGASPIRPRRPPPKLIMGFPSACRGDTPYNPYENGMINVVRAALTCPKRRVEGAVPHNGHR